MGELSSKPQPTKMLENYKKMLRNYTFSIKFTNSYLCSKKILGWVHEQQEAAHDPADEPGR